MALNTLKQFLPVLGLVLVLVIVSMMVVSYFNVNMNDTGGLLKLNRVAIHENMTNIENMDTILKEGKVGLMQHKMKMKMKMIRKINI